MRSKSLFTFLAFIMYSSTLFSQSYIQAYADVANQCSQANITNNLTEYEALGVKRRGTTALQNTLNWLKNKYLSYGYTVSQMQEDSYTYQGSTAACKNLIVTKIGTLYPNTFVIVDGHYDSIVGTGTNDNGSGVVTILEIARLLQNVPTEYSIKFINFSGEEDGLYGSQHYVSSIVNGTNPKMDIRVVFNMDEIGGVAGLTNDTITCERDENNSPSTNNAASATKTNELITCVGLYSPLQTYLSYAYSSDYMPFQANNEVIIGIFETNETTHKHTATDLLVYMDPTYVYNVAKASIGATMHFAIAATTLNDNVSKQNYNISFFPNPTKDSININLGSFPVNDYDFTLIDVNGKVVLSQSFVDAKLVETISIASLTKGMYLGVISAGDLKVTKSILID